MSLNDGVKNVLASRAIWGGIGSIVAGGLVAFGITVPNEEVQNVIDNATGVAQAVTTHNWGAVGTGAFGIVMGALAIYGRIKATKKIG